MNENASSARAGAVIWLTGLSGAGKSTLASALKEQLSHAGMTAVVLDGDVLRQGPCRDLGFSAEDRRENVRRAGEAALERAEAGEVAIVALISPFRQGRARVAARCRERGVKFAEVFVNASLAECERRDPKQLYRRARAGQVKEMSGIDSPYEAPDGPSLEIRTDRESVEISVARLGAFALELMK
jgi:adenylyl-sulfate kinase